MTGVIRWEDRPPVSRERPRRMDWRLVAEQLRARPGEWAVVQEGLVDTSAISRIQRALSPVFAPAGSFEASQRVSPQTRVPALYVRYVGEPSAGSS